jgi:auxin influx carrier (AUX1 LAX family)
MTTYTAWYITIAAAVHGKVSLIDLIVCQQCQVYLIDCFALANNVLPLASQVDGVKHSGPTSLMLYFTGATNILYTFGGHAVTV